MTCLKSNYHSKVNLVQIPNLRFTEEASISQITKLIIFFLFLGLSSDKTFASFGRESGLSSQKIGLRIPPSRGQGPKRCHTASSCLFPRQLLGRPIPYLRLSITRRHPTLDRMRGRPGRPRQRPQHSSTRCRIGIG